MVQFLIQVGANVNARDSKGRTPLFYAWGPGETEMVILLSRAGADVNARDSTGKTALVGAVIYRHDELADALVQAGADWKDIPWNAKDDSERDRVRAFLDRLQGKAEYGLIAAAAQGLREEVRQLLAGKIDVNYLDKNGCSALYLAASGGHEDLVKLLLAAGANVNLRIRYAPLSAGGRWSEGVTP
jgi:ankyrin repeat protein